MGARCQNCLLHGRLSSVAVGHACVDPDPCPKCGGPRTLRVVEVYSQGGALRVWEPCVQCRRLRQQWQELQVQNHERNRAQ